MLWQIHFSGGVAWSSAGCFQWRIWWFWWSSELIWTLQVPWLRLNPLAHYHNKGIEKGGKTSPNTKTRNFRAICDVNWELNLFVMYTELHSQFKWCLQYHFLSQNSAFYVISWLTFLVTFLKARFCFSLAGIRHHPCSATAVHGDPQLGRWVCLCGGHGLFYVAVSVSWCAVWVSRRACAALFTPAIKTVSSGLIKSGLLRHIAVYTL